MHYAVHLAQDLLAGRTLVDEAKDLPICPESVGRLDACKPPPTSPSTLIQHPIEESLEGAERDSLDHPGRVFSCIFTVSLKESQTNDSIAEDGK